MAYLAYLDFCLIENS